jgi:uncharacterized delta-60 repeat protein
MRRFVLTAGVMLVALVATAAPAIADPGDLDPAFGGGTGHTSAVVTGNQDGVDVVVRPSGKVVVVSTGGTIVQFLANGDPDPDFGTAGVVHTPGTVEIRAVALDAAGNLVLAGSMGNDVFVERFLPGGDPDNGFAGVGAVTTHFGRPAYGVDVAVGPNGRIVVAGGLGFDNSRFLVIRYLPGGALDPNFNGDGSAATTVLGSDSAEAVAIANDGTVVVAGTAAASDAGPRSFGVVRYHPNGHLDRTFSGDGKATARVGSTSDGDSIVLQPDGKVVVGGSYFHPGIDWALARFTAAGRLDHSFGGDGKVTTVFGPGTNNFGGLMRQASGDLVACGSRHDGGAISLLVVRYQPNGSLDPGFGASGGVEENLGDHPACRGISKSPHGKVVAGLTVDGAGTDGDLGAARFLAGP